jgi:hypothetical protein
LGSDGIIKAGDISSDINDINVSAAHIRATNLRVHDIYAGGINAVEIHASGNVDAIGPIYAHVLDANNISASLIDADFIRANNIKADFIICQDRVAKKVGESKTNAKVFITNKNNLEKKIGNKNISIVESSDVLFSYSKLVDASILG